MGSYQFLNNSNQVRDSLLSCSSSSNTTRHGFSKSQMCLQKILHVITSYPPHEISTQSSTSHQIQDFDENRVLGIDLNMDLCPWPEDVPQESESLSSCSVVVDTNSNHNNKAISNNSAVEKSSSEGECDPSTIEGINLDGSVKQEQENENENEKKQEILDSCRDERVKTTLSFEDKRSTNSDCIALLIEAAEMVSASGKNLKDSQENSQEKESVKDNGRSKRGRRQVLPLRYRDSVLLEPLKRLNRPSPPPPPPTSMVSRKRGKLNNSKQTRT